MLQFFEELKRRNVIKVAVVYGIVAWLLIQIVDTTFPILNLPQWSVTLVTVLLIIGFPLALVFAWAFELTPEGIKPDKAVTDPDSSPKSAGRKIDFVIISILLIAVVYFALESDAPESPQREIMSNSESVTEQADEADASISSAAMPPLVIMMDSHHPSRVYDEETLASGGTNADIVSDILLDLPIRRQKEAVSTQWHRDEEILGFQPDLIIIHYSAFKQGYDDEPRIRLGLFIEYFADADTQFIIYGRWQEAPLREVVTKLLADIAVDHPDLMERIHIFGLLDHGGASWRDPAIATSFKLFVKKILEIA